MLTSTVLFVFVLSLIPLKAQDVVGIEPWDLKDTEQPGQFVFYDAPAGASSTGKPLDIGDFNGDGCGDIAAAGSFATFRKSDSVRRQAGHVRIIMDVCEIAHQVAIEDYTENSNVVKTIYGAQSRDMAGTEIYVGDFNADGYDDLLVGTQNNDGPEQQRPNAGSVSLILGGSDFIDRKNIDLVSPPDNVLTFYGASPRDRFGLWVDGGDFNNDGFDDALIGANQADGPGNSRINAGEAWIIYGSENMVAEYGSETDMSQPPANATRIIGVDYDDLFGSTTLGADLNEDGYDDAIVSAALWRESASIEGLELGGGDGPDNRRYNSGETFVIFGHADLPGSVVDLAALLDDDGNPVNDSITVIYGPDPNDLMGEELAAGDINGDGRNELALGGLVTSGLNNDMPEAGEAWLIDTSEPFAGRAFDLLTISTERATVIYPDQPDSMGGDILRFADLDKDGYDDLFYGAPTYDVIAGDQDIRPDAGMLVVLFGREDGLNDQDGQIVVPDPENNVRAGYILGVDAGDEMAYGLAIYDVDGDGYLDIAPNGMLGDGIKNTLTDAGEIYVISGAAFLSARLP